MLALSLVMAAVAFVGIGTAALGSLFAAREVAATAAESAALAAAVATYPPAGGGSPRAVAAEMAKANGASLIGCVCGVDWSLRPRTVQVATVVEADLPLLGTTLAVGRARAEFEPVTWLSG